MCLIAFALNTHPKYPLILIGNRDEFHARRTADAQFQPDHPHIYAGRDLQAGGSWLAASTQGRVAAVTNVRTGKPESAPRSRGELVNAWVRADDAEQDRLDVLRQESQQYGRFNLLVYDGSTMQVLGNHPDFHQQTIDAGVHGLSNAELDTPWPKTMKLTARLNGWIAAGNDDPKILLNALADDHQADDADLPDTGVGIEYERILSAAFIRGHSYGTRASTVVLCGPTHIRFIEQRFGPDGVDAGRSDQLIPRI